MGYAVGLTPGPSPSGRGETGNGSVTFALSGTERAGGEVAVGIA